MNKFPIYLGFVWSLLVRVRFLFGFCVFIMSGITDLQDFHGADSVIKVCMVIHLWSIAQNNIGSITACTYLFKKSLGCLPKKEGFNSDMIMRLSISIISVDVVWLFIIELFSFFKKKKTPNNIFNLFSIISWLDSKLY